ncbi:hypothetical protein Tco_1303134 [Tanacetum coccineum]
MGVAQQKKSFQKKSNITFGTPLPCFKICASVNPARVCTGKEAPDYPQSLHNGSHGGHHGQISLPKKRSLMPFLLPYRDCNKEAHDCDIFDVGALTSWGRSRLQEETNIYSWPSITCQNGLRRKRSPPTTPELFENSLNLSLPDSDAPRAIIMIANLFCRWTSLQRSRPLNTSHSTSLHRYHPQTRGNVEASLRPAGVGPFTVYPSLSICTCRVIPILRANVKVNGPYKLEALLWMDDHNCSPISRLPHGPMKSGRGVPLPVRVSCLCGYLSRFPGIEPLVLSRKWIFKEKDKNKAKTEPISSTEMKKRDKEAKVKANQPQKLTSQSKSKEIQLQDIKVVKLVKLEFQGFKGANPAKTANFTSQRTHGVITHITMED